MMTFVGAALCVLFCALLVKERNRTIAVLLTVAGVCLLLFSAASEIADVADRITAMTEDVPSAKEYLRLMMKVLAITLLSQLVANLCRDSGESALAGVTELCAKTAVIVLVLPVFESVITIVSGLIQ